MTYDEILSYNHGIFHKSRLTMDGKVLDDYPENVEFNNMANDSSGIELGTTYASALTLEIRNVSAEILNQEVFVEDGARDPDGNFAWKPLGYFMAVSSSHDRGITKYTLYDRMAYKLAGQYVTSLTFPTTDKAVIEEICTRCGVKLIGTLTAHTIDTAPSGTNKDVLGYMLQLQGKNAVFNENGDLELKWYEDKGYTIDDSQIYMEGDASTTAAFTIGYIKNTRSVKKTETKYEEQTEYDDEGNISVKNVPYTEESTEEQTYVAGDGLQGIVFSNPYMTQAIVNELYEKLKNFSYTPATFHFVGDYRVRAMDIVTVTTDGGKEYKVPVMAIDHSSDGGLASTVHSYGVSESSGSMDSGSSNSRAMERYDADLAYLKAVYANTMNAERAKILFLQTKELQAEVGKFGYVKSKELEAEVGKFGYVKTGELTAEVAKLGYVTAATVEAQYARLDKANIPTAWIDTAMIGEGVVGTVQIADGSITDAKIVGLTASKLTAGRIDAGVIEVVNLNAANITVGTINGVQIAPGAIDKSKLDSLLTDWISSTDTDVDKALKDAGLASSAAATATSTANAASSTASSAKTTADSALTAANASVAKVEVEYYKSTSATALSGGSWSTAQPTWTEGTYIWSRNKTTSKAGTVTYSTAVCITGNTGATGATGAKGDTGAAGRGIKSTAVTYQAGASGTTVPTGTWASSPPATTADKPYMWTRTVYTYTDDTTSTSYSVGATPEGVEVGARNLWIETAYDKSAYTLGSRTKIGWYASPTKNLITDDAGDKAQKMSLTDWSCGQYVSIKKGQQYTFSCDVKLDSAASVNEYTFYLRPDVLNISSLAFPDKITKEWKRITYTYTAVSDGIERFHLRGDASNSSSFLIKHIKMEKGNRSTDWTPAPEDVDSAIDSAQNTADSAQSSANAAQSTANNAVSIANGKTTAYYQTAQPSGGTYKTNDLWFDTDGGYQMYYYNGSKWVATQYGSAAILASAITAEKIAASAVTSGKIAAGAVVADAIAANAVTAGKIATNAVTASTIAANAVTTDKIAANAITSVKIATDAVTADKIVAEAVTSAKLAAGAVIAEKIAANAVTADKIAAKAVTADKMSVTDLSAISAKIGGWELGTGYIRDKDTSNRYAGMGRNGVTYAFFAGGTSATGSDGKFRVGHDGKLLATNATITGNISATELNVKEVIKSETAYVVDGNHKIDYIKTISSTDGPISDAPNGYMYVGIMGDSDGFAGDGLKDLGGISFELLEDRSYVGALVTNVNIYSSGYINLDAEEQVIISGGLTVDGVSVGGTLNSLNSNVISSYSKVSNSNYVIEDTSNKVIKRGGIVSVNISVKVTTTTNSWILCGTGLPRCQDGIVDSVLNFGGGVNKAPLSYYITNGGDLYLAYGTAGINYAFHIMYICG